MDEKYIDELYDYVASQDPTFSNDIDKAAFAQKMQDDAYVQSMHEWISSIDNTFSVDMPLDAFKAKVKKKEGATQAGRSSGLDSSLDSTSSDTQGTGQVTLSGFTRGSRYDNMFTDYSERPQKESDKDPVLLKSKEEIKRSPTFYNPSVQKLAGTDIQQSIEKIDEELIKSTEELVVPRLNYLFGSLGFKFEESSWVGDAVLATAPNGKTKEFDLDVLYGAGAESSELRQWISDNTVSKSDDIAALDADYKKAYTIYENNKQVESEIKNLNTVEEEINNDVKSFVVLSESLEKQRKELESVPESERDANWVQRATEYEKKREEIGDIQKTLQEKYDTALERKKNLDRSIGKYVDYQSQLGTAGGALYNSWWEGTGRLVSQSVGSALDLIIEFSDVTENIDYKDRVIKKAKELGYYDRIESLVREGADLNEGQLRAALGDNLDKVNASIKDDIKKQTKYSWGTLDLARKTPKEILGADVSEMYEQKFKEGFWGGALSGMISSLPSLLGGPGGSPLRVAKMFLLTSDFIDEEMANNPAFADVSENEKLKVKGSIGIVSAVLEEFGLRNIIAQKGIMSSILMRVLNKTGSKTGSRAFADVVRNEVKSMFARGLLTAGSAAAAEFETGALQRIAEIEIKDYYNEIKNKNLFENLPETQWTYIKDVLYSGAQEAVGGFVLGSPQGFAAAYRKRGFEGMSDSDFTLFSAMANDETVESAFVADLKNKVNNKVIGLADAKKILNDYRNARSLYSSLPDGLSLENKKKAMNLLSDRRQIEESIKGKDESLTKKQRAKIASINQQLEELSDAVQEQTTSEVPVQPEARTGEEVAQGTPESESEIIAEFEEFEQGKKPTQEEVTPAEEVEAIEEADTDTIGAALEVPSGVYIYEGEKGNLTTDGKTVVLETPTKVIEIGNVDEISQSTLDDFGLVKEEEMDISVNDDNSVTIKGEQYQNNYSDPLAAISQDKDGNYSVTLDAQNGQKRTFRGQRAQEIVYQYRLKNLEINAEQQIDEAERLTDEAIAAEAEIESTAPKRKGKGTRKAKRKQRTLPTPKAPFNYDKIDSYSEEEIQAEIDKVTKSAQKAPFSEISKIRSRIGALQNAIDKKKQPVAEATPAAAPATTPAPAPAKTTFKKKPKKIKDGLYEFEDIEGVGYIAKKLLSGYATPRWIIVNDPESFEFDHTPFTNLKDAINYIEQSNKKALEIRGKTAPAPTLTPTPTQAPAPTPTVAPIETTTQTDDIESEVAAREIEIENKLGIKLRETPEETEQIGKDIQAKEMELSNLQEEAARAQRRIGTAQDADAAIKEFNDAKKKVEDKRKEIEDIREARNKKITLYNLILDEYESREKNGDRYEFEEEFNQDPRLAAIKSAEEMVQFLKEEGATRDRIQSYEKDIEILKESLKETPTKTVTEAKVESEARPRRTTEYEELSSVEKANAKDKDGKYIPNIYVSDSVSSDIKNFFVFLIESFKPLSDFNVVLLTSNDINNDELLKQLNISDRIGGKSINSFKKNAKNYGFFSSLKDINQNKSLIIYLNDENISIGSKSVPTDELIVLAHEVGHSLRFIAFDNAPVSLKKEIMSEWRKWMAATKGMSTAEVEKASRSILQQFGVASDGTAESDSLKRYFRSFDEWFADRVANYMFTQEKPKSAIDQFFFNIAEQFKKLVNVLKRLNPDFNPIENVPKMTEFLDGIFDTDAYAEYLERYRESRAPAKPKPQQKVEPKPAPIAKPKPQPTEGREFSDAIGTEDLKSIYMDKSRAINTDSKMTPKQKDAAIEKLKQEYNAAKAELTGNNVTTDPKVQEEIERLENEIERTEIDIENLEEEIQTEQENIKDEKQRIKEEKAKVRAQKISREQKEEKIEELDAQLEDYIDEQEAIIDGYKDDLSYLKRDLKKSKGKLDKLKKPTEINPSRISKSISIDTSMPSGRSMSEYIRTGRTYGYSDAKIKEFLKSKGFKAADIKAAMQIFIDPNTPLPSEFNRVEGGYQKAIDMFKDVMNKVSDFALNENSEGEFPSVAEVRRKAIELLSAHPTFQEQNDQTKLQLLIGFDRSLNTKAGVDTNKLMKDIRKSLKDRKAGEKSLRELQVKLKNLVNLAIPKSEYTKGDIARAMALITSITEDNSLVQVDKVMNIVDSAINKNKKGLLKAILNLVTQKAKPAMTTTGKRRSKGLDAEGQSFFSAIRDVVEAYIKEDQEAIDAIKEELDNNETIINEALAKESKGEDLTTQENRLLNRALGFDMFASINDKSVEEITELYNDLKTARAQSIAILKSNRAARAAMGRVIAENATQKTKEMYPFLFNEDGTTKSERDIQREWDKIWNDLKGLKVWSALKQFVEVSKIGEGGFVRQFFVNRFAHIGSLTNILDTKGNFFKTNVYDALNIMENKYNYGIVQQMAILDEIANTIDGIEGGYAALQKLFDGKKKKYTLSDGKVDQLTDDQAMRIYALSLNDEVKKTLERMGYDSKVIDKIKQDLGSKKVEFAEKVVDYLSNQYYESVNSVYSSINDINLGYVENYFPVKRVQAAGLKEALVTGNFSRVFNTEVSPALKERSKTLKEIDLTPTFTSTIDSHLHQMERYKAFAVGTKTLSYLFESDAVKMLLNTTGIGLPLRYAISNTIAPEAGLAQNPNFVSTFLDKLQRKFTSFALAFKLIQIPKQASSFVNAYEDYQYFKGRKVPFLDSIMFAYDMAKVYGNIPKSLRQAQEISPSFRRRLILGIEGDVYGLESGSRVFRKLGKGNRQVDRAVQALQKGAAYPTVIGDAMGVMGYLANYNRNIANGMNPEKAAEAFNDYNATQQSRRGADKIPLQNSQNELSRAFTMFGSVSFLQMNKVYSSSLNIQRALSKGEMPSTKDIRAFALNLGIANVLFVLTANMFKYIDGDDEDKKKVEQQLYDAMIGLNLIYQIPFIGYATESLVRKIRGEKMFSTETLNPIMSVASKIDKEYKASEGDVAKSIVPIIEIALGAQLDPAIGIANLFSSDSEIQDDAMFDILGIAPSYRPSKPKTPSEKEIMNSMKEYNPDLYERMYGPGSQFYDQKERAKELQDRLKGEVKKGKSPLGEVPIGEGPIGKSPIGKSPFQK